MAENEGAAPAAPDSRCEERFDTGADLVRCSKDADHAGAHLSEGKVSDGDDGVRYALAWWRETDDEPEAPEGL